MYSLLPCFSNMGKVSIATKFELDLEKICHGGPLVKHKKTASCYNILFLASIY